MAKKKKGGVDISIDRRIETQTHAAIPLKLAMVLFRTAKDMALNGDMEIAQWFVDELIILGINTRRREYNELRLKGIGKEFYGLPCAECGNPADTIDHIKPISRGGTNELDNLQPMCWKCNRKKSDR